MVENLRGELTVFDSHQHQFSLRDSEVLQSIAEALNLSSSQVGWGIPHTILIPRPISIPSPDQSHSPTVLFLYYIYILFRSVSFSDYSHSDTLHTHFHLPPSISSPLAHSPILLPLLPPFSYPSSFSLFFLISPSLLSFLLLPHFFPLPYLTYPGNKANTKRCMLLFAHHQEVKQVRQVLFPPMMCAAAANGDIRSLESLHDQVRGHVTMGRLPLAPVTCSPVTFWCHLK